MKKSKKNICLEKNIINKLCVKKKNNIRGVKLVLS